MSAPPFTKRAVELINSLREPIAAQIVIRPGGVYETVFEWGDDNQPEDPHDNA
jgi:hypothetical protein